MRLAAFVFSEPAEVSATLASLGEARSERARRAYLEVVREGIALMDGREVATVGDGLLALFETASDALAFAECVQRGCERMAWRVGERLDVRSGIAIGEVSFHDLVEARGSVAAVRARELARAAVAGSVLASGIVAALATGSAATFRPAGRLDLSGADDPLPVVEVTWDRPVVGQLPIPAEAEGHGRTRFVGRKPERERLSAIWRRAVAGGRGLAFVIGEPGIGKTRLVAEFAHTLHEHGAVVLWGRSFEEALTPYQPFVQALEHFVRYAALEQLREQVGAGAPILGRLLPELATRLAIGDLPVEESESERYRLFEAVEHVLATASAERPLLLVLDDLQWADHGTLLLLRHLARHASPDQLLVLGTYRQSEVGRDHPLALALADIESDRILDRIELLGLNDAEIAELVSELIGWEPPDPVVQSLSGETDGNPFFLEEVVRHLDQLGLGGDPERLAHVQATVEELGVPGRVRELVSRRVQRLAPVTRAALSAASVIGSEFDAEVLTEVLDAAGPAHVVPVLDEAVDAQLLVESRAQVGRYGFSHALIQQALYEEQTLNRRAALHEQVAAVLERLHAQAPGLDIELAYHYTRAGERYAAKVLQHGRAAGAKLLELFAYEDAVRELQSSLIALERLAPDDRAERAELLVLLGTARTRAGHYPEARATFREAAELSYEAGVWPALARAVLGFGGGAGFGGVWVTFAAVDDELVRLLELALEVCPAGDSHERVRLLGRLAQALYWAPERERALALSEQALEIARRLGDPAALAYALDSRHVVLWDPDHLDEERALAEEMLQLGRGLGDRDIQLEALAWLITDALERDPLELVDQYIDEHARIAAELRQPYHLWYTEATRAMRAHLDGRFAEAETLIDTAYAHGRQAHGENALQTYLVQTMFVKLDLGLLDDLIDGLREYVAASPLAAWHSALALAYAGLDQREQALEQVNWFAERGFESIRRDCVWMTSTTALARTIAHFNDATHADALYDLLAPFADRNCVVGGAVLCLGPVSRILGMLALTSGRPDTALAHFADALERSHALESAPLVARTQLDAARAHLQRGAEGDRAAAEALLAEASGTADALAMSVLQQDVRALRSTLAEGAAA